MQQSHRHHKWNKLTNKYTCSQLQPILTGPHGTVAGVCYNSLLSMWTEPILLEICLVIVIKIKTQGGLNYFRAISTEDSGTSTTRPENSNPV